MYGAASYGGFFLPCFAKSRKLLRKNRPIFCDFENFFCNLLIYREKKFCQNAKLYIKMLYLCFIKTTKQ